MKSRIGLGLGQRRRRAFLVPGFAHRQLGASNEFRVRISIDERLQGDTRNVMFALLHRLHGTVEEHLVRLLGVHLGQRVGSLLIITGHTGQQTCSQQQSDETRRNMPETPR